jgi:CDP-diacylglycerol--glycerol-3-phosphate 3-phosphatidyltransferase
MGGAPGRLAAMNLPNALTLSRIFLVPLLVVVLLTAPATWHTMWPSYDERLVFGLPKEFLAAAIFGLASLTDWLDGYLARRRRQITALGQMMDPLADKLLTSAAFISLVQMEKAPAWMVAVIVGREMAVTALRSIGYNRGHNMPASRLGKVKMVSEVVAILALILGREHLGPVLYLVGPIALWAAVVLAVVSGVDYYRKFMRGPKPEMHIEG